MAIKNDAEYNPQEILEVLARVLALVVHPRRFEYLRQGIGTNTESGKALLDALAVIKKYGAQN